MGLQKASELNGSQTERTIRHTHSQHIFPREKVIELSSVALNEIHTSLQRQVIGGNKPLSLEGLSQLTGVIDTIITSEIEKKRYPIDVRPEVSLDEYVKGAKDLDIGSVRAKVAQFGFQEGWFPKGEYGDIMFIPQKLCLQQSILREMKESLYYRNKESSLIPLSITQPENVVFLSAEEGRFRALAHEMTIFGVDAVSSYYDAIRQMRCANSAPQLEDIAHTLDLTLKKLSLDMKKRDELISHARKFASNQEVYIHRATAAHLQRTQLKEDIKANSEEMQREFDAVWNDFTFFTPEEEKTFLHDVPKVVLDLGIKARKMVDAVSFHKMGSMMSHVVKEGMHFRTGRADILARYHKKEASLSGDKEYRRLSERFTKKYIERVRDEFLITEAGGFEFRENVKPAEGVDANKLALQTMKTLITEHRPKTDKDIHFTLVTGESMIRKIKLKFHKDMSESEVELLLREALKHSKDMPVTAYNGKELTIQDRVELSFTGYSSNRVKNKNYVHLYGTGNKDKPWGDYLIQIKPKGSVEEHLQDSKDEHSVESLFAVDSHTAAVLIDERQRFVDGKVKTTIRYNHSRFDGIQARTHARRILDNLTVPTLNQSDIQLLSSESSPTQESENNSTVFPILEGVAFSKEEGVRYPKLTMSVPGNEKPITFSPSFTRSFILALANNVTTYHHLHAGDKSKWEFYRAYGDRFDDVQPITTIVSHLERQFKIWKQNPSKLNDKLVQEWFGRYEGAKKRAEKSHSDSMLSAAIVGRFEKAVVAIGSTINKGISAYSSPGSMLSPLPRYQVPEQPDYQRELFFTTAQAMSYAKQKIDLVNPEASMGVIGYNQEGTSALFSCRKLPSQAQVELRDAVLSEILPSEVSPEMTKGTLDKFTTLISSWDSLIKGKTTLQKYLQVRKQIYEDLLDVDICGEATLRERHIMNDDDLQLFLNTKLHQAAEQTLDAKKIEQTKNDFEAFLKASGLSLVY